MLANEDMWMEFQDIELGHWADLNLRKMAEVAKVKDVYDKYYDLCSGYTHGQWVCVRDTVFVNCLNPLHRFHRVPAPPKSDMPSVLADGCKLVNRMLDDLNHLYPTFKPRLRWHHQKKTRSTLEMKHLSTPARTRRGSPPGVVDFRPSAHSTAFKGKVAAMHLCAVVR